jgi:hypothetical protein
MTALPSLKKIIIANSCTQLSVCLYHMMLVMSFLIFNEIQGLTPSELVKILLLYLLQGGVSLEFIS